MIRRNDPCPCGSGRKFKRCCLLESPGPGERTAGEFRFEPGSYGRSGGYVPSLACFSESTSGQKEYRFVLANPAYIVDSEHAAVEQATADFSDAYRVGEAAGSSEALARQLSARGYVSVEDFDVIEEDTRLADADGPRRRRSHAVGQSTGRLRDNDRMSRTAIQLMKHAGSARRENRLADARRDLVEAVALCRQASAQRELVQALKALGQIERDLGCGDAARPLYEEAAAMGRAAGDPLALAHTLRHLGDVHQDSGRMEHAERCYDEALVIYRGHEHAPPLDLANAIRPLAILKDAAGEVEDANRLWEEARDLYEAANVQEGVAECSTRLAQLRR